MSQTNFKSHSSIVLHFRVSHRMLRAPGKEKLNFVKTKQKKGKKKKLPTCQEPLHTKDALKQKNKRN